MTRFFTLLFCALCLSFPSFAQAPQFTFSQLSHSNIDDPSFGFAEARDGSVYFFTGRDDVFVSKNDTIQPVGFNCPSFCRIQNVSVDTAGSLYVATTMEGLFRYNEAGQENILDDKVTSVAVAADGTIYAGTDGNGLAVWNNNAWTYLTKEQNGLPTNKIFQVVIDATGKLWAASNEGLFSVQNGQATPIPIPDQLSRSFFRMQLGADGTIWINSAFGGIGGFLDGNWTVFPSIFSSGKSTSGIAVNSQGVAWTSNNDGLIRVENGVATTLNYAELGIGNGFIVRGMFMDSQDRLWVSLDFSNDLAIVTEELVSGILNTPQFSALVHAFPNPVEERLQINWIEAMPEITPSQLTLYNSVGQAIRKFSIDNGQESLDIDVTELPAGWYTYSLWNRNQLIANGKIAVK